MISGTKHRGKTAGVHPRVLGECSTPLSITLMMGEVCTLSKSVDDKKRATMMVKRLEHISSESERAGTDHLRKDKSQGGLSICINTLWEGTKQQPDYFK